MTATALVIGAGPAGLMAAGELARAGVAVTVAEAKPSVGRKFLMAGKSGLNLTKDEPFDQFMAGYGHHADDLRPMITAYGAEAVQDWARGLHQEVFTGTTGRVFPKAMKASPLLRAWLSELAGLGVVFNTRWRWTGWDGNGASFDTPDGAQTRRADVIVLACGGASWRRLGSDGGWADWMRDVAPFQPANVGVSVPWSDHMHGLFGAAVKSVEWRAGDLRSRGEAVLSARGLEGGGLYTLTPALRDGAALLVDLMPDLSPEALANRVPRDPKKARLSQWLKGGLRLPPVKVALVNEMARGAALADWARLIKALPINGATLRPMDEAISTAGGLRFDALDAGLMIRARPGVFAAGEMLDWEAPTGGYLITACLATGRWAGQAAARYALSPDVPQHG